MRYLVRARLKPGKARELLNAIERGTLGAGSVAGDEYLRGMRTARLFSDGTARWVEVCYCNVPLAEERPYWEEYFDLVKIQDAHARANCRDENGAEAWACGGCDCTARLEARLAQQAPLFLPAACPAVDAAPSTHCHSTQQTRDRLLTATRICRCRHLA